MSIRPLDEQKCPLDIHMSIRPMYEQKCPFDIQMSIRPLGKQKCPVDIQMSIRPMDEQKCPVDIQMSIGQWWSLYADCNGSSKLLAAKCSKSWAATTFSIPLDSSFKFKTLKC